MKDKAARDRGRRARARAKLDIRERGRQIRAERGEVPRYLYPARPPQTVIVK